MKKIFYLEPYVYKQIEDDNFLLYNSLTGKYRFKKNEDELFFFKKFLHKDYIVLDNFFNQTISDFINYLKNNFFGEIRESVEEKHYQHSPNIVTAFDEEDYHNKSLSDFISDLTIYINGECTKSCACSFCKTAYKQFPFCTKLENTELKYKEIEDILSNFHPKYLLNININGGNILNHSEFESIVYFLNNYIPKKNYYINNKNLSFENVNKIHSIGSNSQLIILFSSIPSSSEFHNVKILLENINIPLKWTFVIKSEKDFKLIDNLKIFDLDYNLYPFINSKNKSFIKKNVLLNLKEILSIPKLSYKQILEKNQFNLLLWGKTYILNNKDFYLNLNSVKLGTVFIDNIYDPILNIIINGHKGVWYLTRNVVLPCKHCVYRIFCPPISNYELFSKKYNFCNIKKKLL